MSEPLPSSVERLWLDEPTGVEERYRNAHDAELVSIAEAFRQDGFVRLRQRIPEHLIDSCQSAYHEWCGGQPIERLRVRGDGRNPRVVNLHGERDEFKQLITRSTDVLRVLDFLFGYRTAVYTSLTFQFGTEQPLHRDTPVFRTEPQEFYFGVWFALEDANENNGCLKALQGGHIGGRVDPYEFARQHGRVGDAFCPKGLWGPYQNAVVAKCREEGRREVLIPANKGDVVIWHPQLPHGGGEVKDKSRTRFSTVFHVVPETVPVYQDDIFFNPDVKAERACSFKYVEFEQRKFVAKSAAIGSN